MKAAGLTKEAGLQQMQSYTADETFKFTQDMLTANPNMKAMFIQTTSRRSARCARSRRPIATARCSSPPLTAFRNSSSFSRKGRDRRFRHAAALPHGREVGRSPDRLCSMARSAEKQITVPIVVATSKNIDEILPTIKQTVFANEIQ